MREIILLLIFVLNKPISCGIDTSDSDDETTYDDVTETSNECKEETLVQYLAEMEITNPESIVGLAITNLEPLCRNVYEYLEKFHKYFEACKVMEDNDLYISLITGVRTLRKNLCNTPDFSRRFELYYPCLHELRNDFDNCNGPVDWYEDKDEEQLCKAYKFITDCYYIKSAKVCGLEAAKTLKELTRDIIDSIISVKCYMSKDPDVKDPMPESYICGKAGTGPSSMEVITIFTFLRLYII